MRLEIKLKEHWQKNNAIVTDVAHNMERETA